MLVGLPLYAAQFAAHFATDLPVGRPSLRSVGLEGSREASAASMRRLKFSKLVCCTLICAQQFALRSASQRPCATHMVLEDMTNALQRRRALQRISAKTERPASPVPARHELRATVTPNNKSGNNDVVSARPGDGGARPLDCGIFVVDVE